MDYNSQRERLVLPEYGRLVQQMVDYALTVEDKSQRQAIAEAIVRVMGSFFPQMKSVPEFKHKLWDHLAKISDYRLDIDYPVEIKRDDANQKPEPLPYPANGIRFRHYGHLVEELLGKISDMEDEENRDALIRLTAARMKVNLIDSKGEGVSDVKVTDDIALYTDGKIVAEPDAIGLGGIHYRPADQGYEAMRRKKKKR